MWNRLHPILSVFHHLLHRPQTLSRTPQNSTSSLIAFFDLARSILPASSKRPWRRTFFCLSPCGAILKILKMQILLQEGWSRASSWRLSCPPPGPCSLCKPGRPTGPSSLNDPCRPSSPSSWSGPHLRTRKEASPEHAFLVSRAHAQDAF